jgi:hypothetical protein
MSLDELLTTHLLICDELYRLALEENRHLQREKRPPDESSRERRQELARRLQASHQALRNYQPAPGVRGGEKLEQARSRSLQILHLERENEQLLLRCSLPSLAPAAPPASPQVAQRAYLQR